MIVKTGRKLLVKSGFDSTAANWECRLCTKADLATPDDTVSVDTNMYATSDSITIAKKDNDDLHYQFKITVLNEASIIKVINLNVNSLELVHKEIVGNNTEYTLFSRLTFPTLYLSSTVSEVEFIYDVYF